MKLTITDAEGTIILVVNLAWYDLDNPTSVAALIAQIRDVIEERDKWRTN
jgi:hypothetical protein